MPDSTSAEPVYGADGCLIGRVQPEGDIWIAYLTDSATVGVYRTRKEACFALRAVSRHLP